MFASSRQHLAFRLAAPMLAAAAVAAASVSPASADQMVKIAIDASLTGYQAQAMERIKDGALLAFEEANATHAVPGIVIEVPLFDDSTTAAGGPDAAQAATNARREVVDREIVAVVSAATSGLSKAMAPIWSQGGLAAINPTATNPDLTDPKFAAQYRPAGKVTFFRTCTTDAFQGPNFANFAADTLKVGSVYVVDDASAYGVGIADAFQGQAERRAIRVLGRDRVDEKAADYSAVLTKIRQLGPELLYFGGVQGAGVKIAKQSYDIVPNAIKAAGDGMSGPDMISGAGFPAMEGWYVTLPAKNLLNAPNAQDFIKRYQARFGLSPVNTALVAYDAGLVIVDAMKRLVAAGTRISREALRDAIASASVETLQGPVSFDVNGDLNDHTISIYQFHRDTDHSLEDWTLQRRYIGIALAAEPGM